MNISLSLLASVSLVGVLACGAATAAPFTYRSCTTVPNANGPIDGQNRNCGETNENPGRAGGAVQCGYVTLIIPSNVIVGEMRRTRGDNLGWFAWLDDINTEYQSDGSLKVSTGLKNWSHDRARQFCLEVDTR